MVDPTTVGRLLGRDDPLARLTDRERQRSVEGRRGTIREGWAA